MHALHIHFNMRKLRSKNKPKINMHKYLNKHDYAFIFTCVKLQQAKSKYAYIFIVSCRKSTNKINMHAHLFKYASNRYKDLHLVLLQMLPLTTAKLRREAVLAEFIYG